MKVHVTLQRRSPRGYNLVLPRMSDDFSFQEQLARVKEPLGTRWDARAKTWYIEGAEALLDFQRSNITFSAGSPDVQADINDFYRTLEQSLAAREIDQDGTYGYQRVGAAYLPAARKAILADDMGLGKTKQTVEAIASIWNERGPVPTLIVVLKTLIYNWPREFAKWMPSAEVVVLPDDPKKRKATLARVTSEWAAGVGPILICNYEKLLSTDFPDAKRFWWDIVVADEATYLKNPLAQRSRSFKYVVDRAEYVWLLSGTPVEMRYEELHALFTYIRPSILGSFPRFRSAHLMTDYAGNVIGARNRSLLTERIAPWVLRRTKDDVELQLPPKVYNDYFIEMNAQERREYRQLLSDFDGWLAEQGRDASTVSVLEQLLRMQQYTSSPSLIDDEGARGSKFEQLQSIVNDWERQILIFTRFSQMADRLVDWLGLDARAIIKGDVTSARERMERIEDFNAGNLGKILVSTDAGAHGLNITTPDLVIHYDGLWNPAKLRQREDRLHRIGQENTVNVLRLIVPGTIDAGMAAVSDERQRMADELLDAADQFIAKQVNYRKVARGEYGAETA